MKTGKAQPLLPWDVAPELNSGGTDKEGEEGGTNEEGEEGGTNEEAAGEGETDKV